MLIAAGALLAGCGGSKQPVAGGPAARVANVPAAAAGQAAKAPGPSVPGAAAHASACSYIRRTEMADLLGAPIGPPVGEDSGGTTSCAYPPGAADSYAQAEIEIDRHSDGSPSLEQQLSDAFGDSDAGQTVAHPVQLGDDAFYNREGVLSIRKGKTLVTITVPMRPDSEARAIAIGKTLLARLVEASAVTPPGTSPATPVATPASKSSAAVPQFPPGLSFGEECPIEVANAAAEERSTRVPLKVGLTLASIWLVDGYEFECLKQVTAVTDFYVDVTVNCPSRGKDDTTDKLRLCQSNLRNSYFYRTEHSPLKSIPTVTSATMFSLSSRSLQELKTKGITRHRYIEIAKAWRTRAEPLSSDYDGDLVTQKGRGKSASIIINDKPVELPTLVAIANEGTNLETTATIVDDERFPLCSTMRGLARDSGFATPRFPTPTMRSWNSSWPWTRKSMSTVSTSTLPATGCARNRRRCSRRSPGYW